MSSRAMEAASVDGELIPAWGLRSKSWLPSRICRAETGQKIVIPKWSCKRFLFSWSPNWMWGYNWASGGPGSLETTFKNLCILQRIFRAVKSFYMILPMVIMHLSKPIEYTTPRLSPNVNYSLSLIKMCQRRFIACKKKCATLVLVVESRGGCACVGGWGKEVYGGCPYILFNFIVNIKLLLNMY